MTLPWTMLESTDSIRCSHTHTPATLSPLNRSARARLGTETHVDEALSVVMQHPGSALSTITSSLIVESSQVRLPLAACVLCHVPYSLETCCRRRWCWMWLFRAVAPCTAEAWCSPGCASDSNPLSHCSLALLYCQGGDDRWHQGSGADTSTMSAPHGVHCDP